MNRDDCCIAQNLIALRPNPDICTSDFLYYSLCNPNIRKRLLNLNIGGVQPSIKVPHLLDLEIEIPDLKTQEKIANILSTFDSKIELNQRINENLERQAEAVFENWLSQCDTSVVIGDISENVLDYTPNRNSHVKLLNSSDITNGLFPNTPFVENVNLKGHFKKRFKRGDILYSEIRPRNHHYGYVLFDGNDYICSTRFMVIRNRPEMVSSVLLYQYLLLPKVEANFTLKTETRSGTFPQGNYADMSSIYVPYSSRDNQADLERHLSAIRQAVFSNQIENQQLAVIRDTLLPKLMSGEIDVSNIRL